MHTSLISFVLFAAGIAATLSACDDTTSGAIPDTHLDAHVDADPGDSTPEPDTHLADTTDARDADPDAPEVVTPATCAPSGEPVHGFDPALAARGAQLLTVDSLGEGTIPRLAMDNLWLAWGTGPNSGAAYWTEVRRRYGLSQAPFDNGDLPVGFRDTGDGNVSFDCLLCHADTVAGRVVLGAASSRVDLESLYDDLIRLNEIAPMYGYPSLPVPFDLDGLQAAAGVSDAFGLSMEFAGLYAPGSTDGLNTDFGMQRPTAWWTVAWKDSLYADASGPSGGHRTMMAMLLSFGTSYAELQAREDDIEAIAHYLRSLEPPCWELTALDDDAIARGRAVYDQTCAGCHGDQSVAASAAPPLALVDVAEVGTDPTRAVQWRPQEADFVNASWFGQPPMTSTGAYLAQPLVGIWARAPYFHNGSVPTLAGVLDPASRPTRWRRTGAAEADYDIERVGWRVEVVAESDLPADPDTREGRRVYDTTRPGLSNAGHDYGAGLTDAERADLLEYLRSR